jgi:hypothetical protein
MKERMIMKKNNFLKSLLHGRLIIILMMFFIFQPDYIFALTNNKIVPIVRAIEMKKVLLYIPFTSQSPYGEWDDPMQQYGCEEASVTMVMKWIKNIFFISKKEGKRLVLDISRYEEKNYDNYLDTSLHDTATRILSGYYKYKNWIIKDVNSIQDIKNEIKKGNAILLPVNGKILNNQYFSSDGPERHMLVVIGYNSTTKQIITHDPGTRQGAKYQYSEKLLYDAIRDYPTNNLQPITEINKIMLVIKKK